MKFGVIITTYNSPLWLEKVLWGYENQTDSDFEVIIADDGSGQKTLDVIEKFKERNKLNILHVWHADDGFRKTEILNKALVKTKSDYLMFTDGDCIPRADTIEVHKEKSEEGRFCSSGYYKLAMPVSELISEEHIKSGDAFDYQWLLKNGQPKSRKSRKLTATGVWRDVCNFVTPAGTTWNGANSSAFKEDILAVNGFDERMKYGGEDREMGERMMHNGIKGKQIRYNTICIHLDHQRGYETPDAWDINKNIRKEVAKNKRTWTDFGIKKNESSSH